MKKKILSLSLAAAVIFSLSACNKAETEQTEVSETTSAVTETELAATEASAETAVQTEQSETTVSEDEEIIEGDELIYDTGDSLVWYVIENGQLTEKSDSTEPDEMGIGIIDKLVEAGMLVDGTTVVSFEKIPVSDGMGANADGIFEIFHTEGILDMSPSFTDILNQEDEATQKLVLDAIAESYKKTYGLDIVDIKCGGEPVITDYINYDDIVSEARAAFAVEETELPEFDAAYEEVE